MRLALFLSCLTLSGTPLIAQTPSTGTVTGSVRDSAGAPIAYAQVLVIGTAYSAVANNAGVYWIQNIPATGLVQIRAAFVGFRPIRIDSIQVRPGEAVVVDVVLPPGGAYDYPALVVCECPQIDRDLTTTRWKIAGWMVVR